MELHNYRLLAFADFLATIEELKENHYKIASMIDKIDDIEKKVVLFNQAIFDLLPDCFDNWFYECNTGAPVIEGYELGIGTVQSVFEFFDLRNCAEFMHLFDVSGNRQDIDKYGGRMIDKSVTLRDYAHNIVEFTKKRQLN